MRNVQITGFPGFAPTDGSSRHAVIPSPEEVLAIARHIDPTSRAFIAVGGGLGLRQSEAFGLSVDRVDFLRRRVVINRQLKKVTGSGLRLGKVKTEGSNRIIPLPENVANAIARHAAGRPELTFHALRHFYASGVDPRELSALVIAKRMGNSPDEVQKTHAHLWRDDDDRSRDAIDRTLIAI